MAKTNSFLDLESDELDESNDSPAVASFYDASESPYLKGDDALADAARFPSTTDIFALIEADFTAAPASNIAPAAADFPAPLADSAATGGPDATALMADVFGYLDADLDVEIQDAQSDALMGINAFRANPTFAGIDGSGCTIVVIDTGINASHPYFSGHISYSYDFYGTNDANATDYSGHGSNVASIAMGSTGVAPGANVIMLKVFPDAGGSAFYSDIEEALQWVINNGAAYNVVSVNLSLGAGVNYSTASTHFYLGNEFQTLVNQGVVVVAAAGNSYYSYQTQGASDISADPNVIGVGAVYDGASGGWSYGSGAVAYSSTADQLTPFTQRSTTLVDIFAPGAPITGAGASGSSNVTMHGTSQAAPQIAGVVALAQELAMQTIGRELTVAEFTSLLKSTGASIYDGDDENDNVTNTNTTYKRVDVVALGQAIAAMNHAPTVDATDVTASRNQVISASSLFTATDSDGHAISRYQLLDSTTTSGSGYWMVNGVLQFPGQVIEITASQFSQTGFLVGAGSDQLSVRAYDGMAWGAWENFTVTAPANRAPVVSASNVSAARNQVLSASGLFSTTDADSDSITRYQLLDSTTASGSGYWMVDGVLRFPGQTIEIAASQLAQSGFLAGTGGTDQLSVRAFDGTTWGAWTNFAVTAPSNQAPVVSASDVNASRSQVLSASSLFSTTDADGDAITRYQLLDSTTTSGSGYWMVDGVLRFPGQVIEITAAQLGQTGFLSGTAGVDQLSVRAFDGTTWGAWEDFTVTTPANRAPVVSASDVTASRSQVLSASSLFSTTDADGDAITRYQLLDSTTTSGSGYWMVDGVLRFPGQTIEIMGSQLGQTGFLSGSGGADTLWVRAFDGTAWGEWETFTVSTPTNRAPVVTASNETASRNQILSAFDLFSASDADNDAITRFQLLDSTTTSGSGYWMVDGILRFPGQTIEIGASQFGQTGFLSGSTTITDQLSVRAFDGMAWGNWTSFTVEAV